MPKLTPVHRKRNELIEKRFKEIYHEGLFKKYVFEKIAEEFFLTPAIISRIVQPLNYGARGGKIKSAKEQKEFMREYNKKKRTELMLSIELEMIKKNGKRN